MPALDLGRPLAPLTRPRPRLLATSLAMPPHEEKEVAGWVARWWRALVAELVATALLVALGVGSMLPAGAPLTHPALGFGFVITGLLQAFGSVSGAHMNPAITLAAAILRQIPLLPAVAYVLAQIVGGFVGFGVLSLVAPVAACDGVTLPAAGLGGAAAALVEALLTALLVLAAAALWAAHDVTAPDHAAPAKLGLTVAGLVYAGGALTGASLNPARSLAPAALRGCWRAHWAYWLGPLGGAAAAAALARALLPPRARAPAPAPAPRAPEDLPLRDKSEP